jgi:anion-transporting  ArsA/GET3 family ATPase
MSHAPISALLQGKKIILCCGSGGVGKTTTSAAIAIYAARQGKKVVVCTIDPARRLANSLGLTGIGHDPVRIEPALYGGEAGKGELWAMMLEPKRSFDSVIEKYAPDPETRTRILNNQIYVSIAGRLAGSQEHGAIQKLYDLDQSGKYDLVVLDTPPTQNAIDFLDAPRKMVDAVDSPAIQWFIKPFQKTGSFSLKVLSFSASFVLKNIGRFTGMSFLERVAEFFLDFQHLTQGFREGAARVYERLRSPEVGFLVVTSPEPLAIREGLYFHDRLHESEMPFLGFVVNRCRTPFGDIAPSTAPSQATAIAYKALQQQPELSGQPDYVLQDLARALGQNLLDLNLLAASDLDQLSGLRRKVGRAPIIEIPRFVEDVHDTQGLQRIISQLERGGLGRV